MSDRALYRPSQVSHTRLPEEALEHFKGQIEASLREQGAELPSPWVRVDKSTIQTLDCTYRGRPLHMYASLRPTTLGFGVAYLSDYGTREVIEAPPAVAGQEAAEAIRRTFARVYQASAHAVSS
jgi:hypothetical protein